MSDEGSTLHSRAHRPEEAARAAERVRQKKKSRGEPRAPREALQVGRSDRRGAGRPSKRARRVKGAGTRR